MKTKATPHGEPRPEPVLQDIMTAKEVAEYLRLSHKTVITWATKGQIPGKQIGSSWRFSRKVIENFV
ncbi:helix-turn-helix domain-containing protein [Granulicella aggregans]|uniref:helix-turn-helix domain-containing protein n=1 Tax=Granulicella aggregans TaxID=474949 RepID=UPI00160DC121